MIYPVTILGIVLMFIMVWGALNKPRDWAGTCDERLHFTWHVVQFVMFYLILLSGALATGASWSVACAILGNWRLQVCVFVGGLLYVVLMRVWPKWFNKTPRWL